MSSRRALCVLLASATVLACSERVVLGTLDQSTVVDERGVRGSGTGEAACAPSDCVNTDCACATGTPLERQCARGSPGGSAGPLGLCTMQCSCPAADGAADASKD